MPSNFPYYTSQLVPSHQMYNISRAKLSNTTVFEQDLSFFHFRGIAYRNASYLPPAHIETTCTQANYRSSSCEGAKKALNTRRPQCRTPVSESYTPLQDHRVSSVPRVWKLRHPEVLVGFGRGQVSRLTSKPQDIPLASMTFSTNTGGFIRAEFFA